MRSNTGAGATTVTGSLAITVLVEKNTAPAVISITAAPHVEQNARVQRKYFAWAQGFMSGVLMRAPPRVDEGLELNPPAFPLLKQIEFLQSFCTTNPDSDFGKFIFDETEKWGKVIRAANIKPE